MNTAAIAHDALQLFRASVMTYTRLFNYAIRDPTLQESNSRCGNWSGIGAFTDCLEDHVWKAENEMIEMKKILRMILNFRNSFVKINALPDELLSKIFRLAGEGDIVTGTLSAIRHTCIRWRRVAQTNPLIWTQLHLPDALGCKADSVKHFIQLSQNVPLTITLTSSLLLNADILHFPNVLNRLKHLKLSLTRDFFRSTRAPWPAKVVAPSLLSLSIYDDARDCECNVIPPLFQCSPNLRALRMNGCRFPWAGGVYAAGLTELSIASGTRKGYSYAQPFAYLGQEEGFTAVLRTCTELQHLHLDRLYCVRGSEDGTEVMLKNLRRISLQLPSLSATYILDKICPVPQGTQLRLSYHTSLTTHAGSAPNICLFLHQLRSVAIYDDRLVGRFDSCDILDNSDAHVYVQYSDMHWKRERLPKDLFAVITHNKLCQVENLTIGDLFLDDDFAFPAKLLLACPYAQSLRLVGWRRRSIWKELFPGEDMFDHHSLRNLDIEECDIDIDDLVKCTQSKAHPLSALDVLTFNKCTFSGPYEDLESCIAFTCRTTGSRNHIDIRRAD